MMYRSDRVTTGIRLYRHMGLLVFCVMLCIFLFLAGCASPRKYNRGKLSDVMERASTDYEGERRLPEPENPPFADYHEDTWALHNDSDDVPLAPLPDDASLEIEPEGEASSENNLALGLSGGVGVIKGNDFYQTEFGNLYVGWYTTARTRFELFLGGALTSIRETSAYDRSLEGDVSLVNIGLDYKVFFTPRYTFFSFYVIFGGSFQSMYWRYENPVMAADGEIISRDSMGGFEIHGGLGMLITQTEHFQIGGEILPSYTFWSSTTDKGFSNDVFDPFSCIMFRVTVSFLP